MPDENTKTPKKEAETLIADLLENHKISIDSGETEQCRKDAKTQMHLAKAKLLSKLTTSHSAENARLLSLIGELRKLQKMIAGEEIRNLRKIMEDIRADDMSIAATRIDIMINQMKEFKGI